MKKTGPENPGRDHARLQTGADDPDDHGLLCRVQLLSRAAERVGGDARGLEEEAVGEAPTEQRHAEEHCLDLAKHGERL